MISPALLFSALFALLAAIAQRFSGRGFEQGLQIVAATTALLLAIDVLARRRAARTRLLSVRDISGLGIVALAAKLVVFYPRPEDPYPWPHVAAILAWALAATAAEAPAPAPAGLSVFAAAAAAAAAFTAESVFPLVPGTVAALAIALSIGRAAPRAHAALRAPRAADRERGAYFPALTGLRAVAAFAVFLFHYDPFDPSASPVLHAFAHELHAGVVLFFVLSGFLIQQRYARSAALEDAWFANYMLNRVARIYPLYLLVLFVTFALAGLPPLHETLLDASLAKGLFEGYMFSGIGQAWSLTVEECFYALAPLFFVAQQRGRHVLAPLPLVLGAGCLLVAVSQALQLGSFVDNLGFLFGATFFGRATEFFLGMLAARVLERREGRPSPIRLTYVAAAATGGALSALALVDSPDLVAAPFARPLWLAINDLALPLAIAPLIYGLATERTLLARLLSTRLAILLGGSSYAFYLVHMGPMSDVILKRTGSTTALFAILCGASVLLYKGIEEPLRKTIRAWALGAASKAPAAVRAPAAVE